MKDEQIERILDAIESVSKEGFEVLVRQQVIEGTVMVIVGSVALVVFLVAGIVALGGLFTRNDDRVVAATMVVLFDVIPIVIGVIGVMHLLNPEYYAIKVILNSLPSS